MDLSLSTQDLDQKSKITITKPYNYGEQYKEISVRKYMRKPRNSHVNLDLTTDDVPGAKPLQFSKSGVNSIAFNSLIGP